MVGMQRLRRHGPALSLLLSSHPGPSVSVAIVVAALGAGVGLEPWRLVVLGASVLLGQFSVGLSNDWLDAERDRAVGRIDKPVATGDIDKALVRNWAIAAAVIAIALTLLLGLPATAAHAGFIAVGWCYNLWLKRTAFSVLPYLVGFGVLPLTVTLSLPRPSGAAWWVLGAGSFLGIAAHFANALPDLDADRATGVVGLPHRVGVRASGMVTFASLAVAFGLVAFGAGVPGVVGWVALGAEAVIVAAGLVLVVTRPPARPLFRLVILGALVAVVALVLSGRSLVE